MKVKLKKLLITGLVAFSIVGTGTVTAMAAPVPVMPVEGSNYIGIEPFADQFQTVFATIDGVLHYRVWNATRGRWETGWRPV